MERFFRQVHRVTTAAAGFGGLAAVVGSLFIAPAAMAEPIRGAGSTFAAPIIAKWAEIYEKARMDDGDFSSPDWTVDYELVGSLAGLMRLDQPELDFAATDVPVSHDELLKHGRQQFPIVLGSVAIAVNLDGIDKGRINLTGPLLANIYLGKIQSWADPAIKAINPEISLPDQKISPVTRKDGSGTTFMFTEFLSSASPEWKAAHGADTLIAWPVGTSVEGTGDLIRAVQATKGAIAYADFGQVERANLPYAAVRNKSGQFVKPGPDGVRAAAGTVSWDEAKDFSVSLTDQPGEAVYPISGATFAVVPMKGQAPNRYRRVHDFFRLAFETGSKDAEALGYVPLPPQLVSQIVKYWLKHDASASQ
ncbi:phosphate ABC transporter substrate-binding protein PstS [Rhizobium leguminosarum]|uniref:Phosphate-binding protein PstS n=1 Tax=Rhizobium leguminosarum TaxID=384 RepID=A0A1B1C6X2_RHILE|nr:phosphate ABC transporter substrate-binding protein PstS [Rhizobium leguminosarum]ANP85533.1 phosphate ABC transporter substrate-binding protein PstS [Rhizobium leguminosarum]